MVPAKHDVSGARSGDGAQPQSPRELLERGGDLPVDASTLIGEPLGGYHPRVAGVGAVVKRDAQVVAVDAVDSDPYGLIRVQPWQSQRRGRPAAAILVEAGGP